MALQIEQSFRQAVIDQFQTTVHGRPGTLDYASYLALPAAMRSGDEMPRVDSLLATRILRWLGFDPDAGAATYNENQPGAIQTRPDFVAHGPTGRAFIWEDKATTEDFSEAHERQLRKYMGGQPGYAAWFNGRRLLAIHFASGGTYEILADVSIEAMFGPQPGTSDVQDRAATALELFKVLFDRSRFLTFDELADAVACDVDVFWAKAASLDSEPAQRQFIGDSRSILERLRLAALAQVQSALASVDLQDSRVALIAQEWRFAARELTDNLDPVISAAVSPLLESMENRLGQLHPYDISQVERRANEVLARLPATQRHHLNLWATRAALTNAAARSERLHGTNFDSITDAFLIWRERQADISLATEGVYAEQVAYVFFVRLLLTRILEDKSLLPSRIASDGGFAAWRKLVATYFGSVSKELHVSSFMQLLAEKVSSYYQHFFRQPLYDWFLPDDYLLLLSLEFLSRYSFAGIGSDLLGFTYEGYIDRVAKDRKGHFLTRPPVVEYMLDTLGYHGPDIIGRTLIDPACGSGSFLVHAARRLRTSLVARLSAQSGLSPDRLVADPVLRVDLAREFVSLVSTSFVGMDVDPFSCYLAELNLLIQCLDDLHALWSVNQLEAIDTFRIFNTDSLNLPEHVRTSSLTQPRLSTFAPSASGALLDPSYPVKAGQGDYAQGFYYVICNPPYVSARWENIPTNYRNLPFFREVLSGDANLYLLFVRLGLHYLGTGGSMVFIVPLTLLGDDSASAARSLLTKAPMHTTHLVRFYTGSVLFPGVDQAVTIFRVDNTHPTPSTIHVSGGKTVEEARQNGILVPRQEVVDNVPNEANWGGAWLVSPDPVAYEVWGATRRAAPTRLAALYGALFDLSQGDANATHLNPLRTQGAGPNSIAVYKGGQVARFAPLPPPSAWAAPSSSPDLATTANRANAVLRRVAGLVAAEDGFVLRQVSRLNTRSELKATWFERDASHRILLTNELWRFLRRPDAPRQRSRAVFGLVASNVTCYLINLFSTNNHISSGQLDRTPIPELSAFNETQLADIVENLTSRRADLERTYRPLGAEFPDTDEGTIALSPDAVLADSRLPSATLRNLTLRGTLSFAGPPATRLGSAYPRYLSIPESIPEGGTLAEVLPLFLRSHATERWAPGADVVRLPEPGVAANWLAQFNDLLANLQRDWDAFIRASQVLDEEICDWYGFDSRLRAAIVAGVPWSHS